MVNVLKLALGVALITLLSSCATQVPTTKSASVRARSGKFQTVRTTAYTAREGGSGRHNAIGKRLAGGTVRSAAADWSRYPLGTRFRLVKTNEVFVIDDYGGALVGTNTIDLYKPNRSAVRSWGVRHVDIEILQWGSEQASLKVLSSRRNNGSVRRMIVALEKKSSAIAGTF